MKFIKQNRKYLTSELLGNISNILRFQLKDLYKSEKTQNFDFCKKCQTLLAFDTCAFCQHQHQEEVNSFDKRNFICENVIKEEKKSCESMILCVDLSGSMNCSYPTKYQKINREFVIRALGMKDFNTIAAIISQAETIRNFKGIQVLLQSGQNIRDIAYTFKSQLLRQKQQSLSKGPSPLSQPAPPQYITRKQIIQVGISKYIQQLKKQRPSTLITIVYFNSNIEIPTENFTDKLIIPGLEDKTVEQMIGLGQEYADKISLMKVKQVGDLLISNMAKMEPEGQTALTPAIAFCLGLAKRFKHDFHQIVVVTDGLSNVGFGQTEDGSNLQESKLLYKNLALDHAIKNSCVVNVIGFQDCAIGYDIIDQLITKTGGIPYNIGFATQKDEKIVAKQTIDYLNLQMITGFCESTQQFCYQTKLSITTSNPKIKINCPQQYKKFIQNQSNTNLSLAMGIRSINQKFQFLFTVENDDFSDQYVRFTVVSQYKKKNRRFCALREELVSVRKGEEAQAIKDQSVALAREIAKKLQVHRLQEQKFQDYKQLQQKINQNAKISQNIDQALLQNFRKKKQQLDEYDKNTDKFTKDKRTMISRRHQTYNKRKVSQEDEEEDNGFL